MRTLLTRAGLAGTVLFGGIHALASLYWALGGPWLLDTVGQSAVRIREQTPWLVPVILLPVVAVKLVAITVPVLGYRGRLRWATLWYWLSWAGAVGIIAYGVVLSVVAQMSLHGRFGEVTDRRGMLGHAYLWDPLFALWGISLVVALVAGGRWHRREKGGVG